jgi:hypothetical protein
MSATSAARFYRLLNPGLKSAASTARKVETTASIEPRRLEQYWIDLARNQKLETNTALDMRPGHGRKDKAVDY